MTLQRLRDVLAHFRPALSVEDYQSLQAAVRDAERYRWWRERVLVSDLDIVSLAPLTEDLEPDVAFRNADEFDAAVDRAMADEATK